MSRHRAGKRPGPKPKKGPRQPNLVDRLAAATATATTWQRQVVTWYGQQRRLLDLATGTALWHTDGFDPLPVRWVLIRDPQARLSPYALCCTDPEVDALAVLAASLQRWNVEVTFEEVRAHLGVETQRHWTTRAIGRTTPCLLGLFSMVVLMAHAVHPDALPTRQAAWYAGTCGPTAIGHPRAGRWGWPIPPPSSSASWSRPPARPPERAKVQS